MRRLHYTKQHDLAKLTDELLAAIPGLRPLLRDGQLEMTARFESAGNDIYLDVPDATDETAVAAVVQAHDKTPRPQPNPYFWLRDKLRDDTLTPTQKLEAIARWADFIGKYEQPPAS